MANIKKVVAMLLVILMIFSSMTVLASAEGTGSSSEEPSIPHAGTVSVYTKFYRENGEDEISDGGKVAPGEKIKARVYVGTTFITAGTELLFYYDKNFFDVDYSDQTVLTGNIGTGYTVMAISNTKNTLNSAEESEGTIRVTTECDSTSLRVLETNDWFFEFDLTVAANAATADSDATGSLYLKASNLVTPTNQSGFDLFSWSQTENFNPSFIKNSYQFTIDTDYSFNSVTVNNTVTFKAGTEEDAKTVTVDGVVGADCTVPTFTKENYTLTAWQSETGAELAADATTFTMPNIDGVVYTAVWSTDLTVRFDTDGGNKIDDIIGHYSGETWDAAQKPETPTKTVDGYDYEFMGWLDANNNLLEALPDTYPPVDVAGAVYTYTAKWEKIISVAFYSEGNQVTSYKGNEGALWVDSSATPKYVLDSNTQGAISVAGSLTRDGYSFVGWDSNNDGKADTLPDNYPSVNTTYTAIWKADAVAFEYYFDNTASIQENGAINKTAVSAIVSDSSKLLADESHSYGSKVTIPQIAEGEYVITSWVDEDGNVYTAGEEYTFEKTDLIKLAASATELSTSGNLTATFDPDGGTIDSQAAGENYVIANLKFGDKIVKPTTVTKEGYTFLGWEPEQNTMGETNLVFTAIWSKQEHNAVFMFDNGTGTQIISYSYNDNIVAPVDPERDGYTFVGWDLDDDGVADYTAETIYALTMGTEDMVFTAIWKADEYTITYYKDEAKAIDAGTDKVNYLGVITPMAKGTAEKTGYTQTGWVYYDAGSKKYAEVLFNSNGTIGYSGGNRDDDDQLVMPAYNLVAVPTFERNSYVLTTVFNNDVDKNITNTIEYDAVVENEADPEKEGYIFKGWKFTNESGDIFAVMNADGKITTGTVGADGQLHMPAYDLTATAQWDIESYSLTYDFNGNGDAKITYNENKGNAVPYNTDLNKADSPYQPKTNPTWEGHTFNGWTYADADGVEYAKYVVSYAEDGTATGSFVKDGATVDTITMPAYDLIATAQWTVNKYKLTYTITGDIQAGTDTVEVEYGTEVKVKAIPTETGYTFNVNAYGTTDGWKVEAGLGDTKTVQANYTFTMPANDVTFTGSFEANEYKVTYYVENTQYETAVAYKYKTSVEAKPYPTKEGYTFSGWTVEGVDGVETIEPGKEFKMPANAVIISGKFTINKYDVTVNPDNSEEKYTNKVEYSDTLGGTNLPKTPKSKTGYEFKGWKYTDADGNLYGIYNADNGTFTNADNKIVSDLKMPAYGLTCTAIWNTLNYTVKFLYDDNGAEYKTINNLKVNDAIETVAEPEKEGYTFASWSKTVPATLTAEFITANADANRVITIYALWNINEYTISYSDGIEKKVVYNNDISTNMPANPTRTGYTFTGWTYTYEKDGATVTYGAIDKDGKASGNTTNSKLLMPAYALTATAGWKANEYTYTFDANEGTFTSGATDSTRKVTAEYDTDITDKIAEITNPTRNGYVFKGWATTKSATVADVDLTLITKMTLTDNVTYFAVWEKGKFTVTYKYNDPTDADKTKTQVFENVEFESTPEVWSKNIEGYDFDGWYTADITGERVQYTPGATFTMPGNDVTFEATFSAGDNYIYYYKLSTADSANIGSRKYLTAAAIGTSDVTATNTGYTFTGWNYYSKDDNSEYAQYVVDTYNTDGSVATGHFVKDGATVDTVAMPAYDINAVAQWKINSYTLTYKVTGIDGKIDGKEESKALNYNAEVTVADVLSETGFTFHGWTVIGATPDADNKFAMPANDVTITGYWTANPYTITFNANGGTFGTETTVKVTGTYKDDVTAEIQSIIDNPPTRQYYNFKGWADTPESTSAKYTKASSLGTTITGDKTFYAVWEKTKYTATFSLTNTDGTVTTTTKKLTYSELGTAATAPTKTGYTFNGWYTTGLSTDGSETKVDPNGSFTMPGKNITFTGSYSKIPYTVYYKFYIVKDGVDTPLDNKTVKMTYYIGDTYSTIDTKYEGYNSKFWYLEDSPSTIASLGATLTEDVIKEYFASSDTLYLRCNYTAKRYTTRFYDGTDELTALNRTIPYNTVLADAVPATYEKDGYTFEGWKYYTDKQKTNAYTGDTMPDCALYAYAQFTPIEYTITFNANGGAFSDNKTSITAGYETDITDKLAEITNPTRVGYEFKGWAETDTATEADVVSIPTTMGKDKTYYAVWQVESYTVTFSVDGETKDETYTYGNDLTEPTASKDGYKFDGWYSLPEGEGTKVTFTENGKVKDLGANGAEIKAYAKFTPELRNAIFNAGEGTFTDTDVKVKTVAVLTDAQITPPTINPTRTGYDFKGWATTQTATASEVVDFVNNEVKMPASGITYYAVWVASGSIKVTFYANGGAFKDTQNPDTKTSYAEYDSTTALDEIAKVIEKPTRTGYTFIGWSRDKNATAADSTLGTVNLVNGIDVYAVWSKKSYDLVIDPNNGNAKVEYTSANNNAVSYGEDISAKINAVTTVKEGYDFKGWDIDNDEAVDTNVPSTMPANSLTLKAIYAPVAQNVTFNAGEGTFTTGKEKILWINTDASVTLPEEEPTRAGYSFAGWDVDGDGNVDNVTNYTVPAGGATIKAIWTTGETEYKIEYYYADANNSYLDKAEDKDIITTKGESDKDVDISASVKAPEGYELDTAKSVLKGTVSSTETLVLKVYYKRVVNNVTFIANGGYFGDDTAATADVVKNVIYGATFTAPTVDKVGYSFAGWTYNGNTYSAEEVSNFEMPSYPVNFTAKWNPCDYGVLYEFKDTVIWSDTATYGEAYTVKSITEGEYVITKWTIKNTTKTYDASTTNNTFTFNYTDIITLVGDPDTAQSGNYTATFNPNGGKFASDVSIDDNGNHVITGLATGDAITAPTAPTKTGYDFKGWDSTVATMGTKDVTYTAVWTAKNIPVTYYDEDGTTPLEVSGYYVTVGEAIDVPVVDTEAKTLSYWTFSYTDPATGDEVSFNIYGAEADQKMPVTDATSVKAVAHWDADLYSVIFNPNGGTITGVTTEADGSYKADIAVNDSISNAAPKIKDSSVIISYDGYELVGWDSDNDGNADYTYEFKSIKDNSDAIMGSENVSFKAVWTKATYVVNYYVNGEVANTDKGKYLDPYTVLSYTDGDLNITQWTYDGKTYTAGDKITGVSTSVRAIDLYAVQPTHTATFDPNGGKFASDVTTNEKGNHVITGLEAGATITAPVPTKFGYSYTWDPAFTGYIGDVDVTYTAQWTAKTVKVKYYESADDTNPYEDNVTVGDIIAPSVPVRENADFDHWEFTYIDENGIKQTFDVTGDDDEKMPATESEVTAVAVWTYSVTFDANGGAFPSTVTTETDGTYILSSLSEGAAITAPASPTKSGSKFDSWKYYKIDENGNVSTEEYTGTAMPACNLKAIAQYTEGSTSAVVKLMPAEGNTTVMIERGDGAVETYCQTTIDGFNKAANPMFRRRYAPYGVKSVTKAFDDTYGDYTFNSEDYSTWFVYGLGTEIKGSGLDKYITVSGNGTYEVFRSNGEKLQKFRNVGTGCIIKVFDKDSNLVEQFRVVIFGDIDGNGKIDLSDSKMVQAEEDKTTSWSETTSETYTPYLVRAANVDGDTKIALSDANVIKRVDNKKATINQTTGRSL